MITQRLSLASLMIVLILPVSPIRAQQLSQNAAPEFVPQMGPDKSCVRLAFSPDSRFILTSGLSELGGPFASVVTAASLQVWEVATGRLMRNLPTGPARYSSYLFEYGELGVSPDGKYAALFLAPQPGSTTTVATNARIQQGQTPLVWNLTNGQPMIHSDWTWDAAKQALVNKDVQWTSKEIESWGRPQSDAATKWAAQHPGSRSQAERAFLATRTAARSAFSVDGQYFAQVDGRGDLWDVRKETEIRGFCANQVLPWKSIALSADGKSLAAASTGWFQASSDNSDIRSRLVVWNLESVSGPRNTDVMGRLQSVAILPNAKRFATGTREDDIDAKGHLLLEGFTALWDEASLKQSPPDREYSGATSAVAFSRDGSHLAAGMINVDEKGTRDYVEYQGLLKLWDTAIGKLAWKRVLPDGELSALAFSPDGNTLATGHDGVLVKLFDAKTSNRMHFFTDKDAVIQDPMQMVGDPVVLSLAFSSDGKMLASGGSNGHLYVWDTQTAKQLAHLSEPHFEGELAKMYEIGSQTGTERSAATRQSVEAVIFSPDGKRVYSAGCEGTIKVWDTAVWKQLSTLSSAEGRCVQSRREMARLGGRGWSNSPLGCRKQPAICPIAD